MTLTEVDGIVIERNIAADSSV